jgi:hypothetical protein
MAAQDATVRLARQLAERQPINWARVKALSTGDGTPEIRPDVLPENIELEKGAVTVRFRYLVDAILERGHVPRPFLGVAMQPVPVPETLRAQFAERAEQVLLVLHVEPDSPAASAGVLVGRSDCVAE